MSDNALSRDVPDAVKAALARTPARLLAGRAGPAYRTATALQLREDHAVARDAVHAELPPGFANLLAVQTCATSRSEYLLRPDLGRKLNADACAVVTANCPAGRDVQVVVGDGLSATAVAVQVPPLLDLLATECESRRWSLGRPFLVRFCRVGVMNDVGELLDPAVVVLLIGERPGLATAESLSAYLAFRPRPGHTDARRNLISNIHARGVSLPDAARRIAALAATMMREQTSGVGISEGASAAVPQGVY